MQAGGFLNNFLNILLKILFLNILFNFLNILLKILRRVSKYFTANFAETGKRPVF